MRKKKKKPPDPEQKRSRRERLDVFTIGVGIMAILGLVMVVMMLAKFASHAFTGWVGDEAVTAARAALGEEPSVASVISCRAALHNRAVENGLKYSKAFAAIERRTAPDGKPIHVAVFQLCMDGRHADIEHACARLFSPEELAALAREGIPEDTTQHWKHHQHRPQRR